jgi:hypothetical protein
MARHSPHRDRRSVAEIKKAKRRHGGWLIESHPDGNGVDLFRDGKIVPVSLNDRDEALRYIHGLSDADGPIVYQNPDGYIEPLER